MRRRTRARSSPPPAPVSAAAGAAPPVGSAPIGAVSTGATVAAEALAPPAQGSSEIRRVRVRQRASRSHEDTRRCEPATRPARSRTRQRAETRTDASAPARRPAYSGERADSTLRPQSGERTDRGRHESSSIDVDAARGAGRPRLRRALEITHLP